MAAESGDAINVAFYDTRNGSRFIAPMYRAAALANRTSRVHFHAILKYPVPLPGFTVWPMNFASEHARCLNANLDRLAYGPQTGTIGKTVLHWVLPAR